MANSNTTFNQTVADAVSKGLSSPVKRLPSWLFYDETGDDIFGQIMRSPEYYPTRCEYDILQKHKQDLLRHFSTGGKPFHLVELGAGDGLKTEILLKHFVESRARFTYLPVDISANALTLLTERMKHSMPDLAIHPQNSTYDEALTKLRSINERKVLLFMGANIGNFTIQEAAQFLRKLAIPLLKGDMLLIGFDLMKDPRIIHEAYDDPRGLTANFNFNMLTRLNRELGANFQVENFSHYPYYDPETGAVKSYLISLKDQSVHVDALEKSFHFKSWEPIQTEVSQKYNMELIEKLMALTGLTIKESFCDDDKYFCDVLVSAP